MYLIIHSQGVYPELALGRFAWQSKVGIISTVDGETCDPAMAARRLLLHINARHLQQCPNLMSLP